MSQIRKTGWKKRHDSYPFRQNEIRAIRQLTLGHGFHEVDFLPENDRVRYTIRPEARKTILRRLLLLNHERYAEEEAGKKRQVTLVR